MVIVGFGNYLDTIFMFEYITNLTIVAYLVFNFYSIRYEENSGNDFEYVGILKFLQTISTYFLV